MIDPALFRIKSGDEPLSRADFEECSAWSEHYDRDELDTIASWGVSREVAGRTLSRFDTGGSHPTYTILDHEKLPFDHLRIFLKAEFSCPSAGHLSGFVMNRGELAIGLFIGDRSYVLSRHPAIRSLALEEKKKVEVALGIDELLPLTFETQFRDPEGRPIAGTFSFTDE